MFGALLLAVGVVVLAGVVPPPPLPAELKFVLPPRRGSILVVLVFSRLVIR